MSGREAGPIAACSISSKIFSLSTDNTGRVELFGGVDMMGLSMRDQRRHNRLDTTADAPVRIDINGEDFIEVLSAVDISEGGMGLNVRHRFEGCNLDGLVSMIVQLPAPVNSYFSAQGRIMHISNDAFGVAFVGLPAPARQKIRQYMDSR
jgi:hypothetical protein